MKTTKNICKEETEIKLSCVELNNTIEGNQK